MKAGEKLFHFLARLILEKFYGSVTIRFESGKVTHVETETRRTWEYRNLPVVGTETGFTRNLDSFPSQHKSMGDSR